MKTVTLSLTPGEIESMLTLMQAGVTAYLYTDVKVDPDLRDRWIRILEKLRMALEEEA